MSNATVTVSINGESFSFELDRSELSETLQRDGSMHRYFNNGSKHFIGEKLERGMVKLFECKDLP